MYLINAEANRILGVQKKKFSDLRFTERGHLQEWIAYEPGALGEELLIIQKEFAGFDDTYERLDLLALDKLGNLVIIENKLDDSGRDVVWQALKYASYCASLTKKQIVEIYQQYLDRYGCLNDTDDAQTGGKPNAAELICEFMDLPDLDEVNLNQGNSQRIMLVAANFRKEVTSTALWLLGQAVSIQCFKVSLYQLQEQSLINIDQIIPPPEAKDFVISMGAKEAEEKTTHGVITEHNNLRMDYWERTLKAFEKSSCRLYTNINPNKASWLSAGSGLSRCSYNLVFNKKQIRIELWIDHGEAEENKFIYDYLKSKRAFIEQSFGQPLDWLRKDNKRSSRVQFLREVDAFNKESWPDYIQWHVEHMTRFEAALKEPLKEAAEALRAQSN